MESLKTSLSNRLQDEDVISAAVPIIQTTRDNEMRIVLIGKTGGGKSSTGNTLLGEEKFVEDEAAGSVTTFCENFRATRFGENFRIVDTPGLFDTSMPLDTVAKEISRCVVMLAPGPHAFLFVLRVGRYTEEEQNTVTHLLDIFGQGALNYIIIVFTHRDNLDRKHKPLEDYIRTNQKLKELTDMCPCFAIDNTSKDENQVKELLNLVKLNVQKNGNVHYTNEMLQRAAQAFEEKKQQLEEEEKRKFEEKVRPIREQFEAEQVVMNQKLNDLEFERVDLQQKVESGRVEFQQLLDEKTEQMQAFQEELESANKIHTAKLEQIESEKNNAIREINKKLDDEKNVVAKLEETYRDQLENLRTELDRQRRELQVESDARLDKIMAEYKADNERERQRRDQEMVLVRQAHEKELQRLHDASNQRFNDINGHLVRLQDSNAELSRKLAKKKKRDCCIS